MNDFTRTCSFDGCGKPHEAKGLCRGHYVQQAKGQALRPLRPNSRGLTLEQRFWAKVNKTDGCWEWTGSVTVDGYGMININGRMQRAHRVSWGWANGPIPNKMVVDHRCTNPPCVNPEHLRVVTNSQNMQHRTGAQKNNGSSGVRGVYWSKRHKAWRVQVKLNGRSYSGGYHPTVEAAERAAIALRAQLHTHDDHEEWLKMSA